MEVELSGFWYLLNKQHFLIQTYFFICVASVIPVLTVGGLILIKKLLSKNITIKSNSMQIKNEVKKNRRKDD